MMNALKRSLDALLVATIFVGVAAAAGAPLRAEQRAETSKLSAELAATDPDYCAGIACTEETDSCCDESMGGAK